MILLILTLGVKTAYAEGDRLELTLDGGFVARPVTLDVFSATARVSWDGQSLVRPTKLILSSESSGSLHLIVEDISAFAVDAVLRIALASSVTDHPALRVVHSDGSVALYPANLEKELFSADIPVSNVLDVTVVSDSSAVQVASSDSQSVPLTLTDERIVLTLDSGFVGRPVSLDLFDGEVTVAWDAKTLVKPTTLTVTSARGGTWQEQSASANAVNLFFDDPSAISSTGILSIKHRALRPPTNTERPDVNIFASATSTKNASFVGTSILYSHSAESNIAFAPVYCTGIMRTGMASWYRYKNCLCAASPDVPKGTKLKVSRQDDPSKSVIVTVNDYGPDRSIHPDRVIDLDYLAFEKIGNPRGGVLAVTVDPNKNE
jgi:hypothetical protein